MPDKFIKLYSILYTVVVGKQVRVNRKLPYSRMKSAGRLAKLPKGKQEISSISQTKHSVTLAVIITTPRVGEMSGFQDLNLQLPQDITGLGMQVPDFRQRTKLVLHTSDPQGKPRISLAPSEFWNTSTHCSLPLPLRGRAHHLHSARGDYEVAGGGFAINSLTQLWILFAIQPVGQLKCTHWCDHGKSVTGVTNDSLIGFEACYPDESHLVL